MNHRKSRSSHSQELAVGLMLGALSFLSSFVWISITPIDCPIAYAFRVFPLFIAAFILSEFGFLASLICAAAAHTLLFPPSNIELLQLLIPPLLVFFVHRSWNACMPHLVLLGALIVATTFTPSFFYPISPASFPLLIALMISAVLLSSLIRFNSRIQDQLPVIPPRGWLAHVVPLIIYFFLIPFLFQLSQTSDANNIIWIISCLLAGLFSLAFLPRMQSIGMHETDSSRHLIESLLARPKGFSGIGKEYWKRKDDTPSEALAMTARLTAATPRADQMAMNPIRSEDGVCALSRGGAVSFMNRRFREFLNVSANQVVGKDIAETGIEPEHAKLILSLVDRTIQFGSQIAELRSGQSQRTRFFEIKTMKADALEGSSLSGGPESVIVTLNDITLRRTIESQILKTQRLEALGSISKGTVQSIHESLSKLSECLTHQSSTSEAQKIIEEAMSLTARLVAFSKDPTAQRKFIDVRDIIEQHRVLLEKSINRKIIIEVAPDSSGLTVVIDDQLFSQALTNIILNAHEAYPANNESPITISIALEHFSEDVLGIHMGARAGDFARIRIKDTGVGMTNDVLSHAFDPFFTTKKESGHQGLGLSSVFAIVRDHDGFLTTESSPQTGTAITMYLPIAKG